VTKQKLQKRVERILESRQLLVKGKLAMSHRDNGRSTGKGLIVFFFINKHSQHVVLIYFLWISALYLHSGGQLARPGVRPKEIGHPKRYAKQTLMLRVQILFAWLVY